MTTTDTKHQQAIRTIFIADDDTDDLLLFSDALARVHPAIKLENVRNGIELLSLLSHLKPDLLFLDLEMPGKNGLECLVEIRENPQYTHLPVVVFSSTSRPANIDTAYEMGADLFFVKPANYNELVNSIRSILELDWSAPSQIKEKYLVNGHYVPFV